jgi:uroporphyrinogen decarboxylase
MAEMTKRERVLAAVKGESVDRVPISYYNHNHAVEGSPDTLVPALLEHNRKFNWDFMKVMLRASYYMEAWGSTYRFDPGVGAVLEDYAVKGAEDFKKLQRLDPTKGPFGEQVQVVKMLAQALKGSVPIMQSVFSPLTVAGRLAGGSFGTPDEASAVKVLVDQNPDELHYGLSTITETMGEYVRECIRAGADGIFYTTTAYASLDVFSEDQYKEFGMPYDMAVLEAAIDEGADLNILHICRDNIMFDLLSDYPVQFINYESTSKRNPSLKEAMAKTDKALWGGLDQRITLPQGPIEAIKAQVAEALAQTGGKRFILGPGCTNVSSVAPDEHLMAVKEAAFDWRG